jgi:energy-coupling factor transporter ATP-binding protein EcfA2
MSYPPQRISVVGTSGSGKSTLARALAVALGCTHIELDSIYHQPGWTELPGDEFRARVAQAIEGERWVADGNFSSVCDLVWDAADTVVWVDMPRSTILRRVFVRTLRRSMTREVLWNGNRERWYALLSPHPEHNMVVWSMATLGRVRRCYSEAMVDDRWSDLDFTRLRTPSEVAHWLAGASASSPSDQGVRGGAGSLMDVGTSAMKGAHDDPGVDSG